MEEKNGYSLERREEKEGAYLRVGSRGKGPSVPAPTRRSDVRLPRFIIITVKSSRGRP